MNIRSRSPLFNNRKIHSIWQMIATVAACAVLAALAAGCGVTGQTAPEWPSATPALQPTPTASAADAPALSGAGLPAAITLELTLFGQQIHGFPVTGDAGKQTVMDAVHHHMLSSYALPGVDADSLQDRIAITVQNSPDDAQLTVYYAFDRDGKHCMQAGSGMYSPLSDKVYDPLLELAMGYHLPYALTVRSGKNEIKAMPHIVWSERKEDGLCADMLRYTPEQMADHIQYLELDPEGSELTPFTPYANGEKVYGNYRLYDESFEEIQFIHPSGLEPQTYLFRDCKPGKYIIEMEASFDSEESKDGYQYYFGVVLR